MKKIFSVAATAVQTPLPSACRSSVRMRRGRETVEIIFI